jgi:probable F420-dependent oxidoreductase
VLHDVFVPPLGRNGIWAIGLRFGDPEGISEAAAELDALGYSSLWVPDSGGDLNGTLERLLDATSSLTVASGVLNLWMHDAAETALFVDGAARRFGDRLLIGIGVSHASRIDQIEPGLYRRPLAAMASYLDQLDDARPPLLSDRRVLAALGPKMLSLARDRSAGVHTYNVTPEHTAIARAAVGPDRLVIPEQAVVLSTNPEMARELGRTHLSHYLSMSNYTDNFLRLGFGERDLLDGGSNQLIDALVAWGDVDAIARRVEEHHEAGADHVCVQVLSGDKLLPMEAWRELAPALC